MQPPRRKRDLVPSATQVDLPIAGIASARVPVLLPYPFVGPFDYRVPVGMQVAPGDLVRVPLNRREEIGVVWDGEADGAVGDNRLRPIAARLDAPPMRPDLRRLIDWIASYTLSPPGDVLAMALRVNALQPDPPLIGWEIAPQVPGSRLTEARRKVLAALADGPVGGAALLPRQAYHRRSFGAWPMPVG